jgi:hypothetical protein
MPQSDGGADLPSCSSAAVMIRNVAGGSRPEARQPEIEAMELPVNREQADVPPTASMTSEAEESSRMRRGESSMPAKIVHVALITQEFLPHLWRDSPNFGTIPFMVSKKESPESTQAVAERLRLTREAFHMNKATWCRFVHISPPAWSGVEGTKNTPALNRIALDQALLVCKATGVGLNWIYRGNRNDVPITVAMELAKLESGPQPTAPKRKKPG